MKNALLLCAFDVGGLLYQAASAARIPEESEKSEIPALIFRSLFERVKKTLKPQLIAFAFDSPRETLWRRKLEPNYKADRPPPPPHIVNGLAEIRAFAKAHSHLVLEAEGYEADDVIASVVRKAKEEGFQVLIVSIDKDLFQLVDGSLVHLWDPRRRLVVGPKEVEGRFGVKPSQLADWIALVGDSSDGIPGLPSIGPKRAQELLTAFGSIDGIHAALGRIDVKLRQKFQEHEELLLRYRRLTALRDDVPIGCLRGGLQKPKLEKGGA